MEKSISNILVSAGVQYVLFMPDSLNTIMYNVLKKDKHLNILKGLNETDIVTVCSGLNLGGALSIAFMENSGLRSVADLVARFELSHGIHNIYVLTDRGGVGEENWWGVTHKRVTQAIITDLNIPEMRINCLSEFEIAINNAIKLFKTEQTSVIINISVNFLRSLP